MPFDHFDFIAPFYDRNILTAPVEQLMIHLQPVAGGSCLDVGGGTGRIASALTERGMISTILDSSMKMLLNSRDKSVHGRVLGLSEGIPFAEGSYDRVVIVDAFHHVADQPATIDEMTRVLKPGGRLLVVDPDIRLFRTRVLAVLEKVILMRTNIISGERIAAYCRNSGLQVNVIYEEGLSWVIGEKPV